MIDLLYLEAQTSTYSWEYKHFSASCRQRPCFKESMEKVEWTTFVAQMMQCYLALPVAGLKKMKRDFSPLLAR